MVKIFQSKKGDVKMEGNGGDKRMSYLYCIIAMLGWGSMFIAAKLAFTAISGLTLLFFRYLIALCVLMVVYRKLPRPQLTPKDKKNILFIGVFGYCFSIALQLIGTDLVVASMASIINTITPVAIIVFAVLLLKEKSSAQQVIGIVVTVVGSVIIVGGAGEGSSVLGIVLNFAGMIFWGLSSVMIRRSCAELDGVWVTLYGMFIAMLTSIPFMAAELVREGFAFSDLTPMAVLAIFWVGIVPTAAANLSWNKALERLPAATCSLFYAFLPMITAVLGVVVLGESLTLRFVLGSLVIVLGMVVAVLGERKAKKG